MIQIRRKNLRGAQPRCRAINWRNPPKQNYGRRVFYAIVRNGQRLDTALTIKRARRRAKRFVELGEPITESRGFE